jgi:hypothetical protein
VSSTEQWREMTGLSYDDRGRRKIGDVNNMLFDGGFQHPMSKRILAALDGKIPQLTLLQQREREIDHGHYVLPPCMRRRIKACAYQDEPNYVCSNGAGDTYFVDTVREFIERDSGMLVDEWASNTEWQECEIEDCEQDCCGVSSCTPCHNPDTIELSQPFNDEGPNTMEMSMTVNREKLVEALTTKRDEVKEKLQAKVDEAQTKLDAAKESNDVVAFLEKITELVRDGKVEVYDYNGRQKSSHGRQEVLVGMVSTQRGIDGLERVIPDPPSREHETSGIASLTQQLEREKILLDKAITPYNAALQLLEMSDEESVGIPASEYQRLLAGNPPLQG